MNSTSKLAAIVLAAMVGVTGPALAQALETGTAANRAQLYGHGPTPRGLVPYGWHADRGYGLNAYGMVPGSPRVSRGYRRRRPL